MVKFVKFKRKSNKKKLNNRKVLLLGNYLRKSSLITDKTTNDDTWSPIKFPKTYNKIKLKKTNIHNEINKIAFSESFAEAYDEQWISYNKLNPIYRKVIRTLPINISLFGHETIAEIRPFQVLFDRIQKYDQNKLSIFKQNKINKLKHFKITRKHQLQKKFKSVRKSIKKNSLKKNKLKLKKKLKNRLQLEKQFSRAIKGYRTIQKEKKKVRRHKKWQKMQQNWRKIRRKPWDKRWKLKRRMIFRNHFFKNLSKRQKWSKNVSLKKIWVLNKKTILLKKKLKNYRSKIHKGIRARLKTILRKRKLGRKFLFKLKFKASCRLSKRNKSRTWRKSSHYVIRIRRSILGKKFTRTRMGRKKFKSLVRWRYRRYKKSVAKFLIARRLKQEQTLLKQTFQTKKPRKQKRIKLITKHSFRKTISKIIRKSQLKNLKKIKAVLLRNYNLKKGLAFYEKNLKQLFKNMHKFPKKKKGETKKQFQNRFTLYQTWVKLQVKQFRREIQKVKLERKKNKLKLTKKKLKTIKKIAKITLKKKKLKLKRKMELKKKVLERGKKNLEKKKRAVKRRYLSEKFKWKKQQSRYYKKALLKQLGLWRSRRKSDSEKIRHWRRVRLFLLKRKRKSKKKAWLPAWIYRSRRRLKRWRRPKLRQKYRFHLNNFRKFRHQDALMRVFWIYTGKEKGKKKWKRFKKRGMMPVVGIKKTKKKRQRIARRLFRFTSRIKNNEAKRARKLELEILREKEDLRREEAGIEPLPKPKKGNRYLLSSDLYNRALRFKNLNRKKFKLPVEKLPALKITTRREKTLDFLAFFTQFPKIDPLFAFKWKPDVYYNSRWLFKFVNKSIKKGKKILAESLTKDLLKLLKHKLRATGFLQLSLAIDILKPLLSCVRKRVGKNIYQIPFPLRRSRAYKMSLDWLVKFSRQRSERKYIEKLSEEILGILNKQRSFAVRHRNELYKIADDNKTYLHFRWM